MNLIWLEWSNGKCYEFLTYLGNTSHYDISSLWFVSENQFKTQLITIDQLNKK